MEYKKLRNQWNRRVQEFKQSNKNISEWCEENLIDAIFWYTIHMAVSSLIWYIC